MRCLIALVICLYACALRAADLESVAWLAGCWSGKSGERTFEERWMPPRAGAMVGVARSFRGEKMTNVELTIIRVADGKLGYEAFPVGQSPARFPAVEVEADAVVFEDPAHDFPQRIIYRRTGEREMLARIEGKMDGKERAIDYPMTRVACE